MEWASCETPQRKTGGGTLVNNGGGSWYGRGATKQHDGYKGTVRWHSPPRAGSVQGM